MFAHFSLSLSLSCQLSSFTCLAWLIFGIRQDWTIVDGFDIYLSEDGGNIVKDANTVTSFSCSFSRAFQFRQLRGWSYVPRNGAPLLFARYLGSVDVGTNSFTIPLTTPGPTA